MEYDHPSFDALGGDGAAFSAARDPGGIGSAIEKAFGPSEEPVLAVPPKDGVRVPFGRLVDGIARRDAVVRELTGADDEALARAANDAFRWADTVIALGTTQIGGARADREMLRELTVADRDTLMLAIRIATYGGAFELPGYTCPHCGEKSDLTVHLDDIEIKGPQDPACRVYEVALRRGTATLRQPTGNDQLAFGEKERTAAEQNTFLLSRLIVSLESGGQARSGSLALARELGMSDRRTLLDAIRENTYGPRYDEVAMTHEACGQEVKIPLTPGDLFLG